MTGSDGQETAMGRFLGFSWTPGTGLVLFFCVPIETAEKVK